jgi:hypothetical protein
MNRTTQALIGVALSLTCCFTSCQARGQEKPVVTDPATPTAPPPAVNPDVPAAPAPAPAAPTKKAPKERPRPTVSPKDLPVPFAGVSLSNSRGLDALKVLENNEPEAALEMINDALRESINEPPSVKDDLRLVKGLIQIRMGRPAEGKSLLGEMMKQTTPDVAARDVAPSRKARAIHAAASAQPKGGQIAQEAWREAIKLGAVKMRDDLRKLHTTMKRDAERREWNSIERQMEAARALLEAIDAVRDVADPGVWTDAAQVHADGVEGYVAAMNTRAGQDIRELNLLRPRMFRSSLDPAGNWLPLRDATRWADARSELITMKRVGQNLCTHYSKARSKWGGEAFGRSPGINIAEHQIPETRPGSTFSR